VYSKAVVGWIRVEKEAGMRIPPSTSTYVWGFVDGRLIILSGIAEGRELEIVYLSSGWGLSEEMEMCVFIGGLLTVEMMIGEL
jgi:hypothetical protein